MAHQIRYSKEAFASLKKLRRFDQAAILDQIEKVLAVNPTLVSKAKVKRLRQPAPTQYRLRVGTFRIFYDVDQDSVYILQILSKRDALSYLGAQT